MRILTRHKRHVLKKLGTAACVLTVALLMSGCIMQPADDGNGSVTIAIPSGAALTASQVESGAADGDATLARVWMYSDGREFSLSEGDGPLYAEASIDGESATISIDGIPAGDGYSIVAVFGVDDNDNGVFVPVGFARSAEFSVSAGRETPVSASVSGVSNFGVPEELVGDDLSSVVTFEDGSVFVAGETALFRSDDGGSTFGSGTQVSDVYADAERILSISSGPIGEQDYALINTNQGVVPVPTDGGEPLTRVAESMADAGATDVTFSGTFIVESPGLTETVLFYQRFGGLGGGVFTDPASVASGDWTDSGEDEEFADFFSEDRSPVRAQASGGVSAGYFATVGYGTFRLTDAFFEGEIEIADILDSENSDAGLTFFGVTHPSDSDGSALRILEMAIVPESDENGERLVVGTPRGAFSFETSVFTGAGLTNGLVDQQNLITVAGVDSERIIDLAVSGDYVVVATPQRIVVADAANPTEAVADLPTKAIGLGNIRDIAIRGSGDDLTVFIAGSEGLSVIQPVNE